jgi:UDP-N-acetyl-D-glucosamine dehydrogenase
LIEVRVPTSPRQTPAMPLVGRGGPRRRGRARRTATLEALDRRVAVLGLGYVGLPLALAMVDAGLEVQGVDVSPTRVSLLDRASSPIDDVDDARLVAALARGIRFHTPDAARLADADVIFVCVPTPVTADHEPDLGPVLAAARTIATSLRHGQLVILQSTSYPGTTVGPFRAALEESGLTAGIGFDLAFAPERVNPGDPASAGRHIPRLVGGLTDAATRRAARLLRRINDQVIEVSSPDAAEMAKIVENTFRNINIAFVNQLALLCERMGLDVWEVLDAAGTKPFGFLRFQPGPGVGGHCIPVDPHYLAARSQEFGMVDRLIEVATTINDSMPGHVVDLVEEALDDRGWQFEGTRVGVIGVAFKPGIRDARNAPAADIMAGLAARGADLRFHDPHVWSFRDSTGANHLASDLDGLLRWADVIVIVTPHREIDWEAVYATAEVVIDTVDTSRGRRIRPRQVLALGAGWRAPS